MAFKYREEIVGKRFLSVRSAGKFKINKISEWEWRAGVVRAVSQRDSSNPELSVLVEFDDIEWKRREWVRIYDIFQVFLVESTLVWAPRPDPSSDSKHKQKIWWPALNFKGLVDKIGLKQSKLQPVQFLVDNYLDFLEDSETKTYKEDDPTIDSPAKDDIELKKAIKRWAEYQDGQSILLTTPSVLVGYRVEVYRKEGTTQWYTAVIQSWDESTKELNVTSDTVLEKHNEDPAQVQMRLIGDGVVDSILRGVDIGITPRRRQCKKEKEGKPLPQKNTTRTSRTPTSNQSPSQSTNSQKVNTGSRGKANTSRQKNTVSVTPTAQPEEKEKSLEKSGTPKSRNQKVKQKRKSEPVEETKQEKEPAKPVVTPSSKRIKSQESKTEINAEQPCVDTKNQVRACLKSERKNSLEREAIEALCGLQESVGRQNKKPKNTEPPKEKPKEIKRNNRLSVEPTEREKSPASASKTRKSRREKTSNSESHIDQQSEAYAAFEFQDSPHSANETLETPAKRVKLKGKNKKEKKESLEGEKGIKLVSGKTVESDSNSTPTSPAAATSSSDGTKVKDNKKSKKSSSNEVVKEPTAESKPAVRSTKSEKKTPVRISSPALSRGPKQEENMHFKKKHLLGGDSHSKDKAGGSQGTIDTSGINVNHSLTDQISKMASVKGEKLWNNNDIAASTVCTAADSVSSSSYSADSQHGDVSSSVSTAVATSSNSFSEKAEASSSKDNGQNYTDHDPERSHSRSSEEVRAAMSGKNSSNSSNQRVEDLRRGGDGDSQTSSSSPLVFDKKEPVHVYRDPELLKYDTERRHLMTQRGQPHTPVPTTSSYPSVHTPVPPQHHTSIAGLPGHYSISAQHPSPASLMSALHQHPSNLRGLSPHLLAHPALAAAGGLDHAAIQRSANLTQQQNAALAIQIQYGQMLQQQQQQILQYGLQPNMQTAQLELLWQQKYPTLPVPPAWMLVQYQDELLRDANLIRERELALERERRERDLAQERERAERERAERAERERAERERAERERAERERKEKEERQRIEREQAEKERREKERLHREQMEKMERERVIKESKDAVDLHFAESFRLAMQKTQSDKDLDLMRQKEEQKRMAIHQEQVLRKQFELHEQQRMMQEHMKNFPHGAIPKHLQHSPTASKDSKQGYVGYPGSYKNMDVKPAVTSATSNSSQQVKQEPNFNLYGYQPYQHSYISQDKLYKHGLKPEKVSPHSQHSGHMPSHSPVSAGDAKKSLPSPPTSSGKDSHKQGSVIVDNRVNSLPAAQSGQGSITMGTAVSPRSHQTSPRPSHGASSHQHVHPSNKTSRTQSPLRVASPHQLSAAVMQPMELQKSANIQGEQKGQSLPSPPGKSGQKSSNNQPPVSMPPSTQAAAAAAAYSYSLIQQGLVPNPIYSHHGSSAISPQQKQNSGGQPMLSTPSPTPSASQQKRRTPKGESSGSRKKAKLENVPACTSVPSVPIPMTTPKMATNSNPYTTGPQTTTASQSSQPTTATTTQSQQSNRPPVPSGFIDSFRSFVENTVASAFYQDQEGSSRHPKSRHKAENHSSNSGATGDTNTTTNTSTPQSTSVSSLPTSNVSSSMPTVSRSAKVVSTATTTTSSGNLPTNVPTTNQTGTTTTTTSSIPQTLMSPQVSTYIQRPAPSNTPGGASVSSTSSIVETINRVANGYIDTDSDTLSAPSPPPHIKSGDVGPSPHKSGNHTKFKKAWLQRYSDEDKKEETNCDVEKKTNEALLETASNSSDTTKSESLKDCYVNCSYISPTKEGDSKSPISMLIKDVQREDESSTSASEAEIRNQDGSIKRRKRPKHRQSNSASKKAKMSDSESSTTSSTKKRISRKGKDTEKQTKPTSDTDDSSVSKNRKSEEEEEKPKKVLDLKNEKKPSSDTETKIERKEKKPRKAKEKVLDKEREKREKEEKERRAKLREEEKKCLKRINDNPSYVLANKPLNKIPIQKLKKTLDPFIQDGSCFEITPKLMKCRECKTTPNQKNKKIIPNIFCRFYGFRRLRYSPKGYVTIAGFSEPTDADPDDVELWLPKMPVMAPVLDVETAKYVIASVGDKFCELVEQEKEAMRWCTLDTKIAWKRAVQGVREMCDACDTTLFNMHWVCHKCGFVVCIDCYRVRTKKGSSGDEGQKWLTCSANRQAHEPDKLTITQIIPSDALWVVGRMIHEVREKWGIRANCPCGKSRDLIAPKNGVSQLLTAVSRVMLPETDKPIVNGVSDDHGTNSKKSKKTNSYENSPMNGPSNESKDMDPLSLLADVAARDSEKGGMDKMSSSNPGSPAQDGDKKNGSSCSTLRDLLTKTAAKKKQNQLASEGGNNKKSKMKGALDDIIQQVVQSKEDINPTIKLTHYKPRNGTSMLGRDGPIPTYTLTETTVMFPDVPHSWLDSGRLLRLHEPLLKSNLPLFQQQWRRGQPVLVSNCEKNLHTAKYWSPESFGKDFGNIENDLVNCHNGNIINGLEMKEFWNGFEKISERVTDEEGNPMILKLKDWPPTEDFSEALPTRFNDLMQGLPLPEYTQRQGIYNLASRLPDFFVKPDLGPKMYNAYGSAKYPKEGTTNLHLDMSDAVNVMVYVGIPMDDEFDHEQAALKAIEEAGCDMMTRRRITEAGEKPGALWHIFDAQDADKIRDLLNKVSEERGETIEVHHDLIHDQSWYLDGELRERLLKEYDVQGYTIVQCLGDAVFIPAGAPHQVRNLHSCIKVAEDFVSPENISHCFMLTQEFRHLSDTHSNHEDKLQVKNIIYHAVKDSIAVLKDADVDD